MPLESIQISSIDALAKELSQTKESLQSAADIFRAPFQATREELNALKNDFNIERVKTFLTEKSSTTTETQGEVASLKGEVADTLKKGVGVASIGAALGVAVTEGKDISSALQAEPVKMGIKNWIAGLVAEESGDGSFTKLIKGFFRGILQKLGIVPEEEEKEKAAKKNDGESNTPDGNPVNTDTKSVIDSLKITTGNNLVAEGLVRFSGLERQLRSQKIDKAQAREARIRTEQVLQSSEFLAKTPEQLEALYQAYPYGKGTGAELKEALGMSDYQGPANDIRNALWVIHEQREDIFSHALSQTQSEWQKTPLKDLFKNLSGHFSAFADTLKIQTLGDVQKMAVGIMSPLEWSSSDAEVNGPFKEKYELMAEEYGLDSAIVATIFAQGEGRIDKWQSVKSNALTGEQQARYEAFMVRLKEFSAQNISAFSQKPFDLGLGTDITKYLGDRGISAWEMFKLFIVSGGKSVPTDGIASSYVYFQSIRLLSKDPELQTRYIDRLAQAATGNLENYTVPPAVKKVLGGIFEQVLDAAADGLSDTLKRLWAICKEHPVSAIGISAVTVFGLYLFLRTAGMRGFLAGAGTVWIVTKILDIYDKLSESEKKEVGSRETLEKELRA